MHIMLVGLNHKTAPVELREKVSVSDIELDNLLATLRNTRTVLESAVLSTCNRTEFYAIVSSKRAGEDFFMKILQEHSHVSNEDLRPHVYFKYGQAAVTHLMRVVAGLDSLVIGETQILGQVRNAFLVASDAKNTGSLLNQLFRRAIQLGKQAQTETTIGQSAVSVSYAAVQLAKKVLGNLHGSTVLVMGAGKMSRLTAQHLYSNGIQKIYIANRTFEKAVQLAKEFNGTAIAWNELSSALTAADIVISSTGSKDYVLSESMVQEAYSHRQHKKPCVFIDIAVPRDIHPAVGLLNNVYLYDIDDLENVVEANLQERERQAEVVGKMIQTALQQYSEWLSEQEVVPVITALRARGVEVQSSVMESLKRKLPELTDREIDLIHKHTMSIVNQLLKDPIQNMKEFAIAGGGIRHVRVFAELLGITPEELLKYGKENLLMDNALQDGDEEAAVNGVGLAGLVRRFSEQLLTDGGQSNQKSATRLHPVLR